MTYFHQRLKRHVVSLASLKELSQQALARLLLSGRQYDLVYIDGSHRSMDVISDAVLSRPMIRPRGIMIFDDYLWPIKPCAVDRPRLAIDSFLAIYAGQFRELLRAYQVIVEKIVP